MKIDITEIIERMDDKTKTELLKKIVEEFPLIRLQIIEAIKESRIHNVKVSK